MNTLAQLLVDYEAPFLEKYAQSLNSDQRRALWAMKACHTPQCGTLHYECDDCHYQTERYRSCGHRFCPSCQHHHNQQWLQRQIAKLLPCDYYLITFTLPAEMRALCWQQPNVLYPILFQAATDTLKQFARQHKQLGGKAGMTAVLHTHSRQLNYHPHIHVVMPAAVMLQQQWKKLTGKYLFNGRALAKVFRAKCLAAMKQQRMVVPVGITTKWIAQCKAAGRGDKALLYLSRYLYRGVVNEKNILSVSQGRIVYRYQEGKSKRWQRVTLAVVDFIWRVLQHVLPKGFRRARDYGLLHSAAKRIRNLITLQCRMAPSPITVKVKQTVPPLCQCCGHAMTLCGVVFRQKRRFSTTN